jgi:hypothetical protein
VTFICCVSGNLTLDVTAIISFFLAIAVHCIYLLMSFYCHVTSLRKYCKGEHNPSSFLITRRECRLNDGTAEEKNNSHDCLC